MVGRNAMEGAERRGAGGAEQMVLRCRIVDGFQNAQPV